MSRLREALLVGLAFVAIAGSGGCSTSPTDVASTDPSLPAASATPAGPSPTPIAPCGSLQARIDAAPSGSLLDLIGCTYTTSATIDKPLTIRGATIRPPFDTVGLVVTADDVTLLELTVAGPQGRSFREDEYGVELRGTVEDPLEDIIIRDSEISDFGYGGIYANHTMGLEVSGTDIHDCVYAGIMILSGRDGRVAGNTVARIGVVGAEANDDNAYGIALTNKPGLPRTSGFVVESNTVTDVPTWHALDTHGGQDIDFTDNIVRRSSRGLFITGTAEYRATDIRASGNLFDSPAPVTFNLLAVTTVDAANVMITDNTAVGWGRKVFEDYGDGSSGLVVRDNTGPGWPTIP